VVDHDALAERGLVFTDAGASLGDDTARLMAGDEARLPELVRPQIAAAHAGGTCGYDDFAGTGPRIGKVAQLDLLVAKEDEAFHRASAYQPLVMWK
jgi:hypothetical protein